MGKENEENPVKDLEAMLGLSDDEIDDLVDDANEEDETQHTSATSSEEDVATENKTAADAILTEQKAITTKEIAKIEIKIDELNSKTTDTESFYDNLETHLSEEEQALEFEDKSAYMKLVAKKAKEYDEQKSPAAELEALEAQKSELEKVLQRQDAITQIVAKYPTFDYEKVFAFFENDLSKAQQQSIYDQSKSYEDVYEKTFILFAERNKINIRSQKVPNLPNVNNARKQAPSNREIDEGMSSDEQKLASALGL